MEKKPLVLVAKDARDAVNKLNEYVEKGAYKFEFGITYEYVTTVSKNSKSEKTSTQERYYRFTGFVETYTGKELDSLNLVRGDMKKLKKEREEMNRTLNVMRKSPFAPISVFLLIISLILLAFGILTLAGILPLPASQRPIAIGLVIAGSLFLGLSILLAVLRSRKKKSLLAREQEILLADAKLQSRQIELDSRVPEWYKRALWSYDGNIIKNADLKYRLK